MGMSKRATVDRWRFFVPAPQNDRELKAGANVREPVDTNHTMDTEDTGNWPKSLKIDYEIS
jgi:hypothetical protein